MAYVRGRTDAGLKCVQTARRGGLYVSGHTVGEVPPLTRHRHLKTCPLAVLRTEPVLTTTIRSTTAFDSPTIQTAALG